MRMKKFLVGLMVMMTLTGTLAGCAPTMGNASNASKSSQGEVPEDNFNAEGLPILKEKQTFQIAIQQQSATHPAMNKEIVKEIEEATNVHIEWIEIPTASWKEKTNLMFASEDLPDAFASEVSTSLYYEQLAVLDEMIVEYAPNVQKMIERPGYNTALQGPDGKIHQLPGGDESYHNQMDKTHWINAVWLEKLGLQMPTTTDEYYEVLKAFKTQDPNGNGEADEIPLTFNGISTWATGMGDLIGPFGVVENSKHIIVEEGKAVFPATQESYYEALKWMNKLFVEGLIDQEAFSLSQDQYNSKYKGKDVVGSLVGWRADAVLGPEAKESYDYVVPLKGPEGKQLVNVNPIIRPQGFAITTACEQPEVLIRWYDYLNSSTELALKVGRGPEGIAWKKVDGGKYMFTPNIVPEGMEAGQVRTNLSFAGQTPALYTIEMDNAMIPNPELPEDRKKVAISESLAYGAKTLPVGTDVPENMERRSLLLTDIDTYIQKFLSDAVINGIDDQKWQIHLKALENLKVAEYVDLCQQFIDRMGSY